MIGMAAQPPRPQSRTGAVSSPQASSGTPEDDMFSPTSAAALALSTLHQFGSQRDRSRTTNLRATRLFNTATPTPPANPPAPPPSNAYYHHPPPPSHYHGYGPGYDRPPWGDHHGHTHPHTHAHAHAPASGAPWHPHQSYTTRYYPPPPPMKDEGAYKNETHSPSSGPGAALPRTSPPPSRTLNLDSSNHKAAVIPQENTYHAHPRSSPSSVQGPSPLVSRTNTFDGSHAGSIASDDTSNRRPAPRPLVTPTPKKAKLDHTQSEKAIAAAMIKTPTGYSRKKKSLGILAENFLRTYENLTIGATIIVDEAAVRLGVERRRIYDVVNILESICLVCKKQKNTYTWMGTSKLDAVFGRLQAQAIIEYPDDAKKRLGSSENRCDLPPVPLKPPRRQSKTRENKSLAKLSQEFLQVFLVGHEVLSLPEASDKIQGTTSQEELIALGMEKSDDGKQQDPKELKAAAARGLKTKIRRLYDIANVFLSVGLLKKVDANDSSRRPNFAWSYRLSAKQLYDLHQNSNYQYS